MQLQTSDYYPKFKHQFDNANTPGRKCDYTPVQMASFWHLMASCLQQANYKYNVSGNGDGNQTTEEVPHAEYSKEAIDAFERCRATLLRLPRTEGTAASYKTMCEVAVEDSFDLDPTVFKAFFDTVQYSWNTASNELEFGADTGGKAQKSTASGAMVGATIAEDMTTFVEPILNKQMGTADKATADDVVSTTNAKDMAWQNVEVSVLVHHDLKNDMWNFIPPCQWHNQKCHGMPKCLVYVFYLFLNSKNHFNTFCKKAPAEATTVSGGTVKLTRARAGTRSSPAENATADEEWDDDAAEFSQHSPAKRKAMLDGARCKTLSEGIKVVVDWGDAGLASLGSAAARPADANRGGDEAASAKDARCMMRIRKRKRVTRLRGEHEGCLNTRAMEVAAGCTPCPQETLDALRTKYYDAVAQAVQDTSSDESEDGTEDGGGASSAK